MFEASIRRVGFMGSAAPEESLKRLARAAAANDVTQGALITLLYLTNFAHGVIGTLPDLHWSYLEELKCLKFIHVMDDVEIKLV